MADLLPKGDEWLKHHFNVLLVGLHGVGKTAQVIELCKRNNIKLKYYSCSTLDPYTDLVGVPVPVTDDDGTQRLKMVRPREVDEAEVIFFDEFNRADPKVHNAVLEIIQFGSINGEKLPHLKAVWAAMNPPGKDYNVEDLDPALIDRFDVYEDVTARPSAEYLASTGIRPEIAKCLVAWWNEQSRGKRDVTEQITPRRLEKIGHVYEATGDYRYAIPNWFQAVERTKLKNMLQDAEAKAGPVREGSANTGPYTGFEYNPPYLSQNNPEVASYLTKHPDDHETHHAVIETIKGRQGQTLVKEHGETLAALMPAKVEALLTEMSGAKFNTVLDNVRSAPDWKKKAIQNFTDKVEAEATNRGL